MPPPLCFQWPAPMYGFCTECKKIKTKKGWEEIPTDERLVLSRHNIEWDIVVCHDCARTTTVVPRADAAPQMELVGVG